MNRFALLLIGCLFLTLGCSDTVTDPEIATPPLAANDALAKASVESVDLFAFLPAGDVGGGVLTPGTMYPPTHGSRSKLLRNKSWVQYNIHTTGLPPGAYTIWTVTVNEPENCLAHPDPCSEVDVFGRTEMVDATVFWTDGKIVRENGIGNFRARVRVGELPTGDGQLGWPIDGSASGLQNPYGAEVHLIVKYHGPASDDPDMLYAQTHSLLGGCFENANAFDAGPGFGTQCFDPQVAIHSP